MTRNADKRRAVQAVQAYLWHRRRVSVVDVQEAVGRRTCGYHALSTIEGFLTNLGWERIVQGGYVSFQRPHHLTMQGWLEQQP